MSDILKDFGTHLCSGPPGCRICRLLSECEELRAAICERSFLCADGKVYPWSAPNAAIDATILRVLKQEQEQRNDK